MSRNHELENTSMMRRYVLEMREPLSLMNGITDPREGFERLWAWLPPLRRGSAWTCQDADGGLFLKGQIEPFNVRPKRFVRRRRILHECAGLGWMRIRGIPVPDVLGWGAEYRWGLPVRALMVQRRVSESLDLQSFLADPGRDVQQRAELFRALGKNVAALHRAGVAHRDLYLRNVLVSWQDNTRIVFIDCPRAERMRFGTRSRFLRRSDLFTLSRDALKHGVTVDDLQIFLQAAEAGDPDRVIDFAQHANRLDKARPLRPNVWLMFGI